eukprot:scaffold2.g7429.t1
MASSRRPRSPPAAAPRHRQPPARPLERPQRQPAQPQGAREQRQNEAGEAPLGADAAAEDAPHCLVCCDPLVEVALGRCNHGQACSSCTLRMRLCYGNRDCPFCKQQLDEVLIAPWRPDLPEWEWYEAHPEAVARSRCFAGGTILADRWRPGGRLSSRLLHDLERRTSPACSVCDPGAQAPFPTVPQLARHMRDDHGQRMCNLCLEEGRLFPLEQPVFPSAEALAAHAAERHPRCDFCARRFYGDDELWRHMQQAHYSCHVCPPPAAAFAYFRGPRELIAHLAQEHYACQEPECADCFVAFATQDELRRHHLERHSVRMPRWDASRARPLPLDIQFVRRPAAAGPDAGGAGGGRGGKGARRTRASQDVRMHDGGGGRGDEGGGEGGGEEAAPGSRWEFDREIEGGLAVIDDQAFPAAAAGRGAGADWQPLAGGSWAGRAPPRAAAGGGEEFPSLATAAAVAAAAAGGAVAGGGGGGEAGGGGRRQPPPLLKMVSRCPCGRRTARYALEEGQQPPPLECDGVCQLEGRRAQLADAFGVEHPESHVPSFGRRRAAGPVAPLCWAVGLPVLCSGTLEFPRGDWKAAAPPAHFSPPSLLRLLCREASYSGLLLAAAQQQPKLVEALEKALGAFLAGGRRALDHGGVGRSALLQARDPAPRYRSSQRHTLPPAPREARAVAHALAEQYGLASRGVGQEPARGTELIKTPDAGVPRRLLSRVAATVPAEEVAALLREAAGHPMRLDSVAPSVDLRYYLRRWEGGYALEWESSEAAVVRFARAEDLKDCLDSLGGGIRGLFRVDRSWQPRTAVRPGAAASGRSGCGWGGAAAGVDGASSASSTWTSVALSPPAPAAPPAQQQAATEEEAGPAVRSGWAVIGSKRATRAPAPIASSSSVQQRQGLAGLLPDEEESGGHDDGW